MRQDICRSIDFQLSRPADSGSWGYTEGWFASVDRACDAWLKKNCPEPKRKFNPLICSPKPKPILHIVEPASKDPGAVRVPREKKPKWKRPSVKRYATDEERREALRAIVKAHWASLTPEERAARSAKSNKGRPKRETPRWLDPAFKAYKNEWQRQRRLTHPLREDQLRIRREKAKAKYHANREENRRKINERRLRAKQAKEAAAQEASVQIG